MSLWGKKFPGLGMCVCICETSWDRCPSPPPPPRGQCGQVWSHVSLQREGSPERPAASDTLDIRLWTVFQKALHSLGQELIFFFFLLRKHVYFSRNLIPGVPTPSHLHQLKWHSGELCDPTGSPGDWVQRGLPSCCLTLNIKRGSHVVFRMILTKSCLQMGLDWIFFSHGFFWHIVLLPRVMWDLRLCSAGQALHSSSRLPCPADPREIGPDGWEVLVLQGS